MNSKEWWIEHVSSCDYCISIEESDKSDDEKSILINEHTQSVFETYADTLYEAYKDS